MKRVFSILILCVLLTHFAGFYVYFFIQLKQVRKEMRAQLSALPADKLELIRLSPAEFEKARVEEHEIKVNSKMYDIARIEKKGDVYVVYCLHDKAEDNLLAFLDKVLTTPLKDKKVPAQVLQFISLNFILPSSQYIDQAQGMKVKPSTQYKAGTASFVPSIDSPPPQG